jgi:hypothetical protein
VIVQPVADPTFRLVDAAEMPPLGTLWGHRPTCAHPSASGPRGLASEAALVNLIGTGAAGQEVPFGPAFRLKISPYSMSSSAIASRVCEISSPKALATFKFKTSWNLVGRCTGSSFGLAPWRMRSM